MKIFFITQGSSLQVFDRCADFLAELKYLTAAGCFVTGRSNFDGWAKSTGRESEYDIVLKEWEILRSGRNNPPTAARLNEMERMLGVPTLWPVAVADRRFMNGALSKYVQRYTPPYSHERLAGQTYALVEALRDAFDRFKPDVVISFGPAIAGAIAARMVARKAGIPFLTLKSTKILNLVTLSPTDSNTNPHIEETMASLTVENCPEEVLSFARAYLDKVQAGATQYEGDILPKFHSGIVGSLGRFALNLPMALMRDIRRSLTGDDDHQVAPFCATAYHSTIGAALRKARSSRPTATKDAFVGGGPVVFLPLGAEPEIANSVYAPYLTNQIEVARNVARCIPMGAILKVKDHPRCFGVRTPGYYRALRRIPNVEVVPTNAPTHDLIKGSDAVVCVSSFVATEAMLAQKPVLTFGPCGLEGIPETMVKPVCGFENLAQDLQGMLSAYSYDEEPVIRFLMATYLHSVAINLYSDLLVKPNRHKDSGGPTDPDDQIRRFADYIKLRVDETVAAKRVA